ncbi:MAG TPA: N-acetylmuramic acid 6-phosphate etherase [Bacteroidota bacterium]
MSKQLSAALGKLLTEQRNPASKDLDTLSTEGILRLINSQDKLVPIAVEREIPYIAHAVDLLVEAFRAGGRLIYVGAGTSGRLGIVDASECPPTFGTDPGQVIGLMAGGHAAMFQSQEGAEDNEEQASRDLAKLGVGPRDVVCGIAASRRTPYVVAAVRYARSVGARTLYVTTNPRADFDLEVDVAICPEVGPEVLMGSTRMKSGTAQKLVLNMLTTAAMVRLGKVFENMMVDLQLTNNKLAARSRRIVMIATGVPYETADSALKEAGGHVKTAIVMLLGHVDAAGARDLLVRGEGFVSRALQLQRHD